MKYQMVKFIILGLIIVGCYGNSSSEIQNETQKDTTKTSKIGYSTFENDSIKSGIYNNIKIAFSGEYVTGTFEFYDKWNGAIKDFENVSVFYFYGRKANKGKDTINIISKWPGDDVTIKGKLILFTNNDSIKLILDSQPNGYAAYDLEEGYSSSLSREKKWSQIRLIKSQKVFLRQIKDNLTSPKGIYIIKDDIVEILDEKKQEAFVEYVAYKSGKSYFGWVKISDFYSLNPEEW